MYDAQYSSSLLVRRVIHFRVPMDFPPSHTCCLLFSTALVSAVTNTSKDNASLHPLDPHSSPELFGNFALSFRKSNVITHFPGDHGDGGELNCFDESHDDDDIDK